MKRSEINQLLKQAVEFFEKMNFKLPPFAFWSPRDWESKGPEYDEIRDNMLGWDITDFGSGDYVNMGLTVFTLRNGNVKSHSRYPKPYAEKILKIEEDQKTPFHFHWNKMEDIINRGGGNLQCKVYNSTKDENLADTSVRVFTDGQCHTVAPGTIITLGPGESITLPQRIYHEFWAQKDKGSVMAVEVSSVNDDNIDNRFLNKIGRFPKIDEDEETLYFLCNEYPSVNKVV